VSDHYFSAEPAGPERRRTVGVELAGRRVEVETAGGVFSPDRVDVGTRVLLHDAPSPPPTGTFLDLGCGWGPIALSLALRSPAAHVYAVDVNDRSLRLTRHNAAALGVGDRITTATPEAVPADVTFDLIWSNPPIRVGKDVLHGMLETWLPRLAPSGVAHLVVQKNLGSESLQRWIRSHEGVLGDLECDRVGQARGFRVLEVRWR